MEWNKLDLRESWTVHELHLRMNMLYREIEDMSTRITIGGSCNPEKLQASEGLFLEYTDEYGKLTEKG